MDQIEVRLLGPLRVRRPAGDLVGPREWRTAPTRALVAILALQAGQLIPVEQLLEALWPGAGATAARARLRTAGSQIRKVLGGPFVERVNDSLTLRDAWVDVSAYTRLIAHARRQFSAGQLAAGLETAGEALTLYAGDLCVDLPYAEWLRYDRAHLRQEWLEIAAESGEAAMALGWWRQATALAARIVRVEPANERACRILMRAHSELGELEPALKAYTRCREALADELGVDPSMETQALHRDVLRDTPRAPVRTSSAAASADHETQPVDDLAEQARSVLGDERVVLLELASTLVHPFTAQVLCRLAPQVPAQDVADALDLLEDHMVLYRDGADYRFRPGVRQAVYRWLRPSMRRLLHEKVAYSDVLPRDERIAHWIAAGKPARARRTGTAHRVAVAPPRAVGSTVAVTTRLSELGALAGAERMALLESITDAARRGGNHDLAATASDVALAHARQHMPEALARVLRQRAALGVPGEPALEWARRARDVAALDDFEERARIELVIGGEYSKWSTALATATLGGAVELADRAGDPRLRVKVRSALVAELVAARRFAEARTVGMDAAGIADTADDPAVSAEALLAVRAEARLTGDVRTALPSVERAWSLVAGGGDAALETIVAMSLARTLHELGRPEGHGVWMMAGQAAESSGHRHLWDLCGAQITLELGQLRACRHHLARAMGHTEWSAMDYQWARLLAARLHAALRDPATAIVMLREAIAVGRWSGATLLLREAEARLAILAPPGARPAARSSFGAIERTPPGTVSREGVVCVIAGASQAAAAGRTDRAIAMATAAAAAADVAGLAFHEAEAISLLEPLTTARETALASASSPALWQAASTKVHKRLPARAQPR